MATSKDNQLKICRRKIIIGDVHGCFDELMLLLNKLNYNSQYDDLYFVGDLVGKGFKSNQVLNFMKNTPNIYSIIGNHDLHLLRAAKQLKYKWPKSCKYWSLYPNWDKSNAPYHYKYQILPYISLQNIQYLTTFPLYLKISDSPLIYIVHAGIIPGISIQNQSPFNLLNIRNIIHDKNNQNEMIGLKQSAIGKNWTYFYHEFVSNNKIKQPMHIFYGHDSRLNLQIKDYTTGLDTGCCNGKKLTAAVLMLDTLDNNNNNNNMKDHNIYESKCGFRYQIVSIDSNTNYKFQRNKLTTMNNDTYNGNHRKPYFRYHHK